MVLRKLSNQHVLTIHLATSTPQEFKSITTASFYCDFAFDTQAKSGNANSPIDRQVTPKATVNSG